MELKICHLYPDVLNLYGDRGNIICLQKRMQWRGFSAQITELPIGEKTDMAQFDLFFIGGGQDFEQDLLIDDLSGGKADGIKAAVEDGKTFLAICGGYQILGNYYLTHDGRQCDFIGALNIHTVGQRDRMIGDYIFACTEQNGGSHAVAFENHSGRTYLGSGVSPLGTVIKGFGNNGEDGTEGARYNNVFGSYGHGPLLPKNPMLADVILRTALERKYGSCELAPLNDGPETIAHEFMTARFS